MVPAAATTTPAAGAIGISSTAPTPDVTEVAVVAIVVIRPAPAAATTVEGVWKGSDPNGARITQAFGSLELAANLTASLFYASIYYLPSLDSLFCFSTGYREQMVGLRAALDGTRFIAVRSVTYPLLTDQVQ